MDTPGKASNVIAAAPADVPSCETPALPPTIRPAKKRSCALTTSAPPCAASAASSASRATPLPAGSKKASSLAPLERTRAPAAKGEEVLELDELCSFVRERENKRWVWLALCRRTRQVVACKRSATAARRPAVCCANVCRRPTATECSTAISLGELAESAGGIWAPAGGQKQWANQPRGALELHPAPAPGTFCEEDALVFEERGDARDLPDSILARLQSALLKQHRLIHYQGVNDGAGLRVVGVARATIAGGL